MLCEISENSGSSIPCCAHLFGQDLKVFREVLKNFQLQQIKLLIADHLSS